MRSSSPILFGGEMLNMFKNAVAYFFSVCDRMVEHEWVFQEDVPVLSRIHPTLTPLAKIFAATICFVIGVCSLGLSGIWFFALVSIFAQNTVNPMNIPLAIIMFLLGVFLIVFLVLLSAYVLYRGGEVFKAGIASLFGLGREEDVPAQ